MIPIGFDIVEVHMKLQKNREEAEVRNDPTGTIRARIAAAAAEEQEAEKMIVARTAKVKQLLDFGYNRSEISQRLQLHPYIVDSEISRIEKEEKERRRFLATGRLPDMGSGSFSLMNGIPTPRR